MSYVDPLLIVSAFNMAVVSVYRITSSGNRIVLDREYDSISDNLSDEIRANPDLRELYKEILKVIQRGRLRDYIRKEINTANSQKKQRSIGEIIRGNVLKSFSSSPVEWLKKLAMSSASEYFTQRKEVQEEAVQLAKNNNDTQLYLKHDELNEYDELQRKLFDSSGSLILKYDLSSEYSKCMLTQSTLKKFSAAMNEPLPSNRQEMMKRFKGDFEIYAPYWFYRMQSAREAESYDEAGKFFERFCEVWRPVMKKDPYRVEAMKYRIEELMRSGINQTNAGEILKCLDDMRANTELDDWANNIFAGMVYFSLGRKDEAIECVRSNVLFNYENEMSNKVLERMETEELPPRIDPLPDRLPETTSDEDFLKLCVSGKAREIEDAIMSGANVNTKDSEGFTALIEAAREGHTKVVELLLKFGANANARTDSDITALMVAKNAEIAELLLAHGANVNSKDNDGKTALSMTDSYSEIARLLRSVGAEGKSKRGLFGRLFG